MDRWAGKHFLFLGLMMLLILSCNSLSPGVISSPSSSGTITASPTKTPFQPLIPSPSPAPVQQAAPTALLSPKLIPTVPTPFRGTSIWIDPRLPDQFRSGVLYPPGSVAAGQPEGTALRLEYGAGSPVSRWIYALAAPFPTLIQGVTSEDLRRQWSGQAAGPFAGLPLLLEERTLAAFTTLWGEPATGAVKVLPSAELVDYAWKHRPAWSLLPFEAVEPRWKVLEVDGQSPMRKEFDPAAYPLSIPISLVGNAAQVPPAATWLPATNRDPAKLTVLVMTGTTALVRATAFTMERRGITYPGRDVRDWLRGADITHISNEVPFAKDCPFPDPLQKDMRFCSDPRYIGLLEDVGTDVVELTGDHFQDWGVKAMKTTLAMYKERGWGYYGGGANLEEARQPLIIENNGNRLAFIGCNAKGGSFAQAGTKHPGAVRCDFNWMQRQVSRLRQDGYLPIVSFQHFEYYTYKAQPNQVRDFERMARAGAVIVSGSQAHQPQAFDFVGDALIHYGLGNLFFDQLDVSQATRQAFIDRHVFYNGRYLGVEPLPILFVDYARPRPMTPNEARDLLKKVFKASGW